MQSPPTSSLHSVGLHRASALGQRGHELQTLHFTCFVDHPGDDLIFYHSGGSSVSKAGLRSGSLNSKRRSTYSCAPNWLRRAVTPIFFLSLYIDRAHRCHLFTYRKLESDPHSSPYQVWPCLMALADVGFSIGIQQQSQHTAHSKPYRPGRTYVAFMRGRNPMTSGVQHASLEMLSRTPRRLGFTELRFNPRDTPLEPHSLHYDETSFSRIHQDLRIYNAALMPRIGTPSTGLNPQS